MDKKAVTLLFVVLITTGCQGNIKSSDPVTPMIDSDEDVVAQEVLSDVVENDAEPELEATTPDAEASQPEPEAETLPSAAQQITQRLIKQGEQALASKRLLTPEDDNANMYFQAALGRDPGNFEAIHGIAAIVEQYTQWAWQTARSRDYAAAERYLDLARSVNPEDALIVEVASRVKDLQLKRKQHRSEPVVEKSTLELKEGQYLLPKELFSLNDDEIIEKIQPIIDNVEQTQDSLAIYWPNDKEARLIYQIINSRVADFRVRAMIYHRADYMVELQQD